MNNKNNQKKQSAEASQPNPPGQWTEIHLV
jgi:hypothetical protein